MNEILKDFDFKTRLMFVVFAAFVRLLNLTYRYRVFGLEHRRKAEAGQPSGAFALATWHGNSYAGTIAHGGQKISPLCSRSKDGSMVAYLCLKLRLKPVRGSSSRGGKAARDELLENIKLGYSVAITVDGPTGPPHVTKPGIVSIAKESGVMILPMVGMGEKYWQLRSWDRLKIPKPFSRVAVVYSEPMAVKSDAEGEVFQAHTQSVTAALNELETSSRHYFDRWKQGSSSF